MRRIVLINGAVLLGAAFISGGRLSALTTTPKPASERLSQAGIIVQARVQSADSAWEVDSSERKRIITTYRLVIFDVVKGSFSSRTFDLKVPGGTVGGVSEVAEDRPSLHVGTDGLWLISRSPEQGETTCRLEDVFHIKNGKVLVDDDEIGIEAMVSSIRQSGTYRKAPADRQVPLVEPGNTALDGNPRASNASRVGAALVPKQPGPPMPAEPAQPMPEKPVKSAGAHEDKVPPPMPAEPAQPMPEKPVKSAGAHEDKVLPPMPAEPANPVPEPQREPTKTRFR